MKGSIWLKKEAGMNNKKWALFIIGICFLFMLGVHAETRKLRGIGRFKLANIKNDIPTKQG